MGWLDLLTLDPAHIDVQGTAAAVQAVGSVLAILVAVAIDQGSARRLQRDRQAEWDSQRRDQAEAKAATRAARITAVRRAAEALDTAAHIVRKLPYESTDAGRSVLISDGTVALLQARERALDYFLTLPSELDAEAVTVLTLARERMVAARMSLGGSWQLRPTSQTWPIYMRTLDTTSKEIFELLSIDDAGATDLV